MKKIIKQISATTLALLLLSNTISLDVYATSFNNNIATIEESDGDGDSDTTPEAEPDPEPEAEATPTPVSPTVNTNFGTVTRTYELNATDIQALEIKASVTDSGSISYQWYKNGEKITGETSSTYTPTTTSSGTFTYYCIVTNTLNGKTVENQSDSASIQILESSSSGSGSTNYVDTPTISEHYASYIHYELHRPANELTLQINSSRIESDSISFKWYKSSINNTGSGEVIHSGSLSPYTITTVSVTPDTSMTGTYYYYCVVTNHKDGKTNSITSNVANVTVSNNYYGDYNSQLSNNGYIHLGSNQTLYIDRGSLENYLSRGGTTINVHGSNIQKIRVPATNYNTAPYYVNVNDSYTGLKYSWKINNGTIVSSYLDLVVNTATSLSNVNKSYTNLNYDPSYSQVVKFNHEGSLNTNGSTMLLQVPTTVKNGTVWLYKLSGKSILANTELQANVSNGTLYANMQSCSNWLISANKLIDVTTENVNPYYYNIKTDARLSIPQFQNVVIGGYLDLTSVNTNFFNGYRFEGWFYDTAFKYPVTGHALTNMLITADVINNGIYPKLTYYNTYVPEVSNPVPGTNVSYLSRLF